MSLIKNKKSQMEVFKYWDQYNVTNIGYISKAAYKDFQVKERN